MSSLTLEDQIENSVASINPTFLSRTLPKPGGVDPLGLRQTNFELMDNVLPEINNVARHIRPFVLVTWAWRRAAIVAKQSRRPIHPDFLRDFVDRIEVIYVWSMFSKYPDADLPGRDVIRPILESKSYTFGGPKWDDRREIRKLSTSLMAPINYGPSLKMLRWIAPSSENDEIMVPTSYVIPALDEFEKRISRILEHSAFNRLGSVKVDAADVRKWANVWDYQKLTTIEKTVSNDLVFGRFARKERQNTSNLLFRIAKKRKTTDASDLRRSMSNRVIEASDSLKTTSVAWRRLQIRQLFRLCLESLFFWILIQLSKSKYPLSSNKLAIAFASQARIPFKHKTSRWLSSAELGDLNPVSRMEELEDALADDTGDNLAKEISTGLALCLNEKDENQRLNQRIDRLPIYIAQKQTVLWGERLAVDFLTHVVERWIFAQHCYWSIGRGLSDARAQGKSLLRIRVVLEEGGWTLAPGAGPGARPVPTADRLATAINLAVEGGLLSTE